jgi:transposase
MRSALPAMTEEVATPKRRFRHAHEGRKTLRLRRLDGLASGQAHTRQDVARRLGVHRQTIGHWLARSEAGGLATLLALDVPAGKPLSLPPDVLAAIEPALRRPAGLAS